MINGPMAEARQGYAVLETVDADTMERFVEWLYGGYYTPAKVQQDLSVAVPPLSSPESGGCRRKEQWRLPEEPSFSRARQRRGEEGERVNTPDRDFSQDDNDDHGHNEPLVIASPDDAMAQFFYKLQLKRNPNFGPAPSSSKKAAKTSKSKKELKKNFLSSRIYRIHPSRIDIPPIRANQGPQEDFTEVFLSHARLHVFADMYDIRSLKILTFEALHDTLCHYTLHRDRTGDIVALLRYVYANSSPPPPPSETKRHGGDGSGTDSAGGEGPGGRSAVGAEGAPAGDGIDPEDDDVNLRSMMTDYVHYEMIALMTDEKFHELIIEEGGQLLADFMKMVALRIH